MKASFFFYAALLLSISLAAQKRAKPGETFTDCADCPQMVVIPAGKFMMGAPLKEVGRYDEEGPVHQVNINEFAAGKFDVTLREWSVFVTETRRKTSKGCAVFGKAGMFNDSSASWTNPGFPQEDSHPVVCITWYDVRDYLVWLSQKTGANYRLLTESEWEYAARGGTTTPYPWGSTASHEHANYGADVCCSGLALGRDKWIFTSPVGSFSPNAFGLYDMHGNVMQFVQDCFVNSYSDTPNNGSAYMLEVNLKMSGDLSSMNDTNSCSYRLLRGGDWGNPPGMIRSASRNWAAPAGATLKDYKSCGMGFRVAKTL